MDYLEDIISCAVLLDTQTIDAIKSENSVLMHSLYALADIGNGPELLKLIVEEIYDPNAKDDTFRSYKLRNIEKQQSGAKGSGASPNLVTQTAAVRNIADLYELVKQKDTAFVAGREVSPLMLNADGTPKVFYHGSPAEFRAFDKKKSRRTNLYGRGFYFTESESHGKQYGNLYKVYLNLAHPLTPGGDTVTRDQVRAFLEEIDSEENEDYDPDNYGYGKTVEDVLNIVYKKDAFAVIQDINAAAIGDFVDAVECNNFFS